MNFDSVKQFENVVADFFGAPYGVAVDCCTHGLELCLRYTNADNITIPARTYISVPFLAMKLNLNILVHHISIILKMIILVEKLNYIKIRH